MRSIVGVLLPLLLVGAQTALAHHCTTYSTSTNEFPEGETLIVTTPDTVLGRYYLVNEVCQLQCIFAIFVWQESNEIAGLQRADDMRVDTCHDMITPDTLVNF